MFIFKKIVVLMVENDLKTLNEFPVYNREFPQMIVLSVVRDGGSR